MNVFSSTSVNSNYNNQILNSFQEKQIELGNGITRIEYPNGMIEEFSQCQDSNGGFFQGTRFFPSGMIEKGTFDRYRDLKQGQRIKDGMTNYIGVQILSLPDLKNGSPLTFGFIKEGDKERLRIFEKPSAYGNEYILHSDQTIECITHLLLQYVQAGFSEHNCHVYESLLNSLEDASFFLNALDQPSELFKGSAPIFYLRGNSFFATLKKSIEINYIINLKKTDPRNDKSLFERHFNDKNDDIAKTMIRLDPTAFISYCHNEKAPLTQAIFAGHENLVHFCLSEIKKQNIKLTSQEKWLKKAFKNNTSFSHTDFQSLDYKLKKQIYRTANIFNRYEFVTLLNTLGMVIPNDVATPARSPSILSESMDAASMRKSVKDFIVNLRHNHKIFTQSEFEEWNKVNNWTVIPYDEIQATDRRAWIVKKGKFGLQRILGRDFIDKKINELKLKHIKVPKKIAVIEKVDVEQKNMITLTASNYAGRFISIESDDLSVYVEAIKSSNRKISQNEMEELLLIIETVGFCDLHDFNFIIAEDGIYFIDTEYKSFANDIQWEKVKRLEVFLEDQYKKWFEYEINCKIQKSSLRSENPSKDELIILEKKQKACKLAGLKGDRNYSFSITELLNY